MGCPNFFKYHPEATIHDYMEKFSVDSYDQAVEEIKSFNLGHEKEEKIIRPLSGNDISFHENMKKDVASDINNESGLYAEKSSEKNRAMRETEQYNKGRNAQELYVREIKKIFEGIYEDPDIDDEKLDEFVETVYGKLKEIYSSEEEKETGGYGNEDEDMSRDEKMEMIAEMIDKIDSDEVNKFIRSEILDSKAEGGNFETFRKRFARSGKGLSNPLMPVSASHRPSAS